MDTHPWSSEHLLHLSSDYWQICTLQAAVSLDIFTAVGKETLSASEIAARIAADPRAASRLLNALAAMKLLEKREDTYRNTDAARIWLSKDSPDYIGYIILHHHHLMQFWSHLDEVVKSGRPNRSRSFMGSDEQREWFLMGMFNIAMKVAPLVTAEVDLAGRRHLLDLGGGPGTYAVHFCRKYPDLQATVFDLPTTRSFFKQTVDRFGLTDRIAFREGDFVRDDIGGDYDVVLLSQVLHGEGPETCGKIIGKAVTALTPGGMIIVHEFILDDSMDGPLHPALFSLNMLLGTESGQSYSEKQIMDMLADAGARKIRRLPFKPPGGSGLIVASA